MDGKPLEGKITLVAGATRGAGRGIARALGAAGATVICTGRSSRGRRAPSGATEGGKAPFALAGRPETIEETAELVTGDGGVGVPMVVDHTDAQAVGQLCQRVGAEYGRLDLLVNDVWGGDELAEWGTPLWQQSVDKGRRMFERAVFSHIITAQAAVPLLLKSERGLVVEVTDGASGNYRGNFFYDLAKMSVIRLAFALAEELRPHNVAAVAVTPGFLRSEAMLEHFGVSEANWRDGGAKDPHFLASETPAYVGRAVAALAADREIGKRSGRVYSSWGLSREYGFTDADGARPDWDDHLAQSALEGQTRAGHRRFIDMFDYPCAD